MKSLLIKVGKMLNALKSEGLLRGGKRILFGWAKYFYRILKPIGHGDVLFVSGGIGDSARYRAVNAAEEMNLNGFRAQATHQESIFLQHAVDKFKVFVFHRTLYTPQIEKFIGELKKSGKEIIFDADDLVFDSTYFHQMDYYQKMNSLEKRLYENGLGGEIVKDPYVKVATAGSTFLKTLLEKYGKTVFVVKNRLSVNEVKLAEKIYNKYPKKNDGKVRIGYLSGTSSHDKDFAVVTEALMTILGKYPQVLVYIVGPLNADSRLNKYGERVVRLPYACWNGHMKNNAMLDINLAPLEIGNDFCESKTELKFFEAGIVGTPTVASATLSYLEAIEDGVDGYVASTTEEWLEKLSKLIEDANLRKEMGEKARVKVVNVYTTENGKSEDYYEYLRSLVDHE